ncbi:MAG: hypothetical protein V7719_02495 [Psychroserpens sp.]|uniref:hypothetical protein n=1 Tax=Psychroserpens sp. TaxID=2020870 RepID=UPI003001AD46
MKTKNILTLLFVAFMGIAAFSQNAERKNKLKFNSFSFTLPEFSIAKGLNIGLGVTLDASVSYNNHVFAFAYSVVDKSSSDGWFEDSSSIRFVQSNFLYGREFRSSEHFFIDIYAGIGFLNYDKKEQIFNGTGFLGLGSEKMDESASAIGFPVVMKFRYLFREHFSLGIRVAGNFNSVSNLASFGLLFQWNY